MNNQHDAMVSFTEDGKGGVKAEAGTVIDFNEDLLTHRMVDAVQEMHVEIAAKARGEFTDGERYRALRAMLLLNELESPLVDLLNDKVQALNGDANEFKNEAEFDRNTDFLIRALNEMRDEVLAKDDAEWLAKAAAAREEGFVDRDSRKELASRLAQLHDSALETAAFITDTKVDDSMRLVPKEEASPIIIPGARKLVDGEGKPINLLVPETTLPEA